MKKMNNVNNNQKQNMNIKEEIKMKNNTNNVIATPQNTPIVVIDHNKYGSKVFRAFGAYTVVENGKKRYVPAHLEARGIGNPQIAKIAFNEWVRKEHGATVFFFSRDIKGVREGCYFKEVTDKVIPPKTETPAPAPVVEVPVTKGIRVLVTGTNVDIFENKEFKLELHNLIIKAKEIGVTTIEFNNNGSLGTAFIELGKKLYAGYQQKGLQVYTCIVADGIHSEYFATIDTGAAPDPEPILEPPTTPKPSKKVEKEVAAAKTVTAADTTTAKEEVRFFTDGSAKGGGENRRAGWGWVCENSSDKANGFLGNETNNVAELTAIKEALLFGIRSLMAKDIRITTDSKYAIDVITGVKKAHANLELISEIQELTKEVNVNYCWCKGHAGNALNEECDRLAKAGADEDIYDDDLEREAEIAELDAQPDPTENPAITAQETTKNADVNSVKSPETEEEVSSNARDTSQNSEVSNAAEKKEPVGQYCCKKAVKAKDFWPETSSGKTEAEVWDLIDGIVAQNEQ